MDDWRERAACLDEDPELFFPIGNTGPALIQIAVAKAVCRRCEVIETCLQSASDHGVWGGLDEDERRGVKRRARVNANRATARERLYAAQDGQPDDEDVPAARSA